MTEPSFLRILLTGESGWGENKDYVNILDDFIHNKLKRDDTIKMISVQAKQNKKKRQKENLIKREEYRQQRLKERRARKKKKQKEENSETEGETSEEEQEEVPVQPDEPKKIKKKTTTKKIKKKIEENEMSSFAKFEMRKNMAAMQKFNYIKEKNKLAKKQYKGLFEPGELEEMEKDYEEKKIQPFLYTRDRKVDMLIRNNLMFTGFRIIQYRAEWKSNGDSYDTSAGITRNNFIFNMTQPPDLVVILTNFEKENEGIAHVISLAQDKKIPILFINSEKEYLSFEPIEGIETELIEKIEYTEDDFIELKESGKKLPKIGTDEHTQFMDKISKKMKKDLYFLEKAKPKTKILTNEDIIKQEKDKIKKMKELNKKTRKPRKPRTTKKKTSKTTKTDEVEKLSENMVQLDIEEYDE